MLKTRARRRRKRQIWDIRVILLESFFIVLAVLLALAVNAWNTNRANQQLVNQILDNARTEIAENLAVVEEAAAYREELLGNLQSGKHVVNRIEDFTSLTDFHDLRALQGFLDETFGREGLLHLVGSELQPDGDGRYWMNYQNNVWHLQLEGDDLVIYGTGNLQLRSARLSDTVWNTAQAANALIHMDLDQLTALSEIYATQTMYKETTAHAVNLLYSNTGSPISAMMDMHYFEHDLIRKYRAFLEME